MPEWRDEIRRRLEAASLPPTREAEIVEEVAQHLDDRYRELRAGGQSDTDAAAIVWREIEQGEALAAEIGRVETQAVPDLPARGAPARGTWLASVWQDLHYAIRSLRSSPGFASTVLLAIALSIGPLTAILSIGNWLLWRPHPGVTESHRLAAVWFGKWQSESSVGPVWVTYSDLDAIAPNLTYASGLAGVQEQWASVSVPGIAPQRMDVAHVTANFFDVLGVRLRAGRAFWKDEDRGAGVPVAMLSEGTARSIFGTPEAALDQSILLNSRAFRVIGVAPAAFLGTITGRPIEIWIPGAAQSYMNHRPAAREPRFYSFVARLSDGASFPAMEAELNGLLGSVDASRFEGVAARVFPGLGVSALGRAQTHLRLQVLLAIGGVLLALGCANAANLLIFRATRREREMAVRKALGASRARLIQAHVTESCVLALSGAALGLGLGVIVKKLIENLLFSLPAGTSAAAIDWRVLMATAITALGVGLLSALAPAFLAVRARISPALQSGSRASTRAPRLRGGLAALQLALSLTLLVGALLLVTTLRNLKTVDLGFDPTGVTSMWVGLDSHGYDVPRALQYFGEVLSNLEGHGGFDDVAAAYTSLGAGVYTDVIATDGGTREVAANGVTHGYFRTLSIPILRGRVFTAEEAMTASGVPPVVVNETLARRVFGTVDVVGRSLRFVRGHSRWDAELLIIGVVGDTHADDLTAPPEPVFYEPFGRASMPVRGGNIVIRSALTSAEVGAAANAIASRKDPTVPLSAMGALSEDIEAWMTDERLFAWMLSLLGALGFVLAALGLYGLVSQSTIERRREFGIRIALGAARSHIIRLVARYVVVVSSVGIGVGLAAAYFGTRIVEKMLFGVSRLDPLVYAAAIATLMLVVTLASVAPVVRALRVQPVDVLRTE